MASHARRAVASLAMRRARARASSNGASDVARVERRAFTRADVEAFARVTGDENPVHGTGSGGAASRLGEPAVHGMLVASAFGALLARWKPGAVYASQELKFRAPTRVDEELEIEVRLVRRSGTRARYETTARKVKCGTVCVDGVALALLPEE